jgi:hypothetical protein
LFALSLAACAADTGHKTPPMNPAPRSAWIHELVVESPVRPVQRVEMVAEYAIVNPECLAREAVTGAPTSPSSEKVPLHVEAIADGGFRATVFDDLLLPADLYGKGECRWGLAGVYSTVDDGIFRLQHSGAVVTRQPGPAQQVLSYTAFERERFDASASATKTLTSPLASLWREQPVGAIQPDADFVSRFPLDRYVRVRSVGRPAN